MPAIFSAPRGLPAAHGEDHRRRVDLNEPLTPADGRDHIVGGEIDHHGVGQHINFALLHLIDKPLGVFRPGQLLLKIMQAEARVDALLQNTA